MLLVVAWDGACFETIEPLLESGRMPATAALLARSATRRLTSTTPAATFPAWTTFATAASPARHGVTDFTVRDGYRLRFLNASDRRLPAFWSLAASARLRVGVYALPATYPPDRIEGLMVCGFDTPLGPGRTGARTYPVELEAQIVARYGGSAVGGPSQTRIEDGWHERALAAMLDTIRLRTRIVRDMMIEQSFDCFLVHFGESDTVAHQFWHLCDPRSPRFVDREPREAIPRIYEALDRSLATLLEAAGEDASILVVSDHGTGGTSDRAVFWNRWLADHGYLRFEHAPLAARAARAARRVALEALPRRWQASLIAMFPAAAARLESRVRLGGIDWSRTTAFSDELSYFPSIWLNRRDRDPEGIVDETEVDAVTSRLTRELLAMRDPFDGGPVVERVRRRAEIADGPFAERLPDLTLELREPDGFSYAALSSRAGLERRALRRLTASEASGARGGSMPGAHRNHGMCILAGPDVRPGSYPLGALADAGATVMALCGCAPHPQAEGRPWRDCIDVGELRVPGAESEVAAAPQRYDTEQEREVEARLRALGYLA